MEKKKYNFKILGQDLPILSDEAEEYVDSLYRHILAIAAKYDEDGSPYPMSVTTKALYCCVELADELFKKHEEQRKAEKNYNKELAKKNKEIEKLKKDLEEFINEFDSDLNAKEFESEDINEKN